MHSWRVMSAIAGIGGASRGAKGRHQCIHRKQGTVAALRHPKPDCADHVLLRAHLCALPWLKDSCWGRTNGMRNELQLETQGLAPMKQALLGVCERPGEAGRHQCAAVPGAACGVALLSRFNMNLTKDELSASSDHWCALLQPLRALDTVVQSKQSPPQTAVAHATDS